MTRPIVFTHVVLAAVTSLCLCAARGEPTPDSDLATLLRQSAEANGKLQEMRREFDEKARPHRAQVQKLGSKIEKLFQDLLPTGKQPYGDFEWSCNSGSSFISINAKDADGKQHVWAQAFYHPDMSERDRKSFSKKCLDYPAKRFENKWVWVLVGRMEVRFGLNDPALESDETLDKIVGSFDLKEILKL